MKLIQWKITASLIALMVLIFLIQVSIFNIISKKDYTDSLNLSLQTGQLARWVAAELEEDGETGEWELSLNPPLLFFRQRILIHNDDKALLYDTGWITNDVLNLNEIKKPVPLPEKEDFNLALNGRERSIINGVAVYFTMPVIRKGETRGYVTVMADKSQLQYRRRGMKIQYLLLLILAFSLSLLIIAFFHRQISRPIGDLTKKLQKKNGEISEFTADVLHELKNPLTSIRTGLETGATPEDLISEIGRTEGLLNGIYTLSRFDNAPDKGENCELQRSMQGLRELYSSSPVLFDIRWNEQKNYIIPLSDVQAASLFRNLIDNALSFSPPEEKVILRIEDIHGLVRIAVIDKGPGIPSREREKVFDRFYSSRPGNEHYGLGLAIVSKTVDRLNGWVHIEDNTPRGTIFIIEFPL